MSSVYVIRNGESGRISQCLCIRNEAAIHARGGGGKGVEVTYAKVDEASRITRALMRWAQDRFGGLTDGTKNSVKFLVASFHRHSEDFSQSWTREFSKKT